MAALISDLVEVSGSLPEGVHYKLPPRSLGRGRWAAWIGLCVVPAIACWLVAEPVANLREWDSSRSRFSIW